MSWRDGNREANVSELLGKTMTEVRYIDEDNEIHFYTEDGKHYKMFHEQDCCESVYVEDIAGNLQDLVGSPITMAEESTNEDKPAADPEWDYSYTWTFYKFATVKGYVTLRWYGTSNGYYSESVDFDEVIS